MGGDEIAEAFPDAHPQSIWLRKRKLSPYCAGLPTGVGWFSSTGQMTFDLILG